MKEEDQAVCPRIRIKKQMAVTWKWQTSWRLKFLVIWVGSHWFFNCKIFLEKLSSVQSGHIIRVNPFKSFLVFLEMATGERIINFVGLKTLQKVFSFVVLLMTSFDLTGLVAVSCLLGEKPLWEKKKKYEWSFFRYFHFSN